MAAREAVRTAIELGTTPIVFPDLWGKYKGHFRENQGGGKCAFCEQNADTSPSDVEHYAPKGAVQSFSGMRAENSVTRWSKIVEEHDGRRMVRKGFYTECSGQGFWWLAYCWDNWLFACATCNQGWKLALFPVEGGWPQGSLVAAPMPLPLLLSPYDEWRDPSDHLCFREDGTVIPFPGSVPGRATIDTCGLDRPSLVRRRGALGRNIARWCKRLNKAEQVGDPGVRLQAAADIVVACTPDSEFAGLARFLVLQLTGYSWKELRDLRP